MSSILVGLGNPGASYENSRHNVGFRVMDAIAREYASAAPFRKMTPLVDVQLFTLDSAKIILAKPQTFMNLSGRAVRFLMDFYKITVENIYVFHDDLDLPFSTVKIKKGGGNGGHNGLKSIDAIVGTDYWRIRLGTGRPEYKSMISDYVLENFDTDQTKIMNDLTTKLAKNIHLLFPDPKKLEQYLREKQSL